MKRKTLVLLFAVTLSSPLGVIADSRYPAADFKPIIIFVAESVKSNNTSTNSSAFDANYPAANFQPKILFIAASANKSTAETSSFDPAFPAANFEPKVIYP